MLAGAETFTFSLGKMKKIPSTLTDSTRMVVWLFPFIFRYPGVGRDQGKGEIMESMGVVINMLMTHFVFSPLFLHQIVLHELTCTLWGLGMETNLFALRRLCPQILEAKMTVGCKMELSEKIAWTLLEWNVREINASFWFLVLQLLKICWILKMPMESKFQEVTFTLLSDYICLSGNSS